MITPYLGLSAANQRALLGALATTHQARIRVQATALDGHNYVSDLTRYVDDGQVDVDYLGEVSRSCTLTLHDPDRSLPFDTNHPSDTALFADRAIRVWYDVFVNGSWVEVPVMTGPITKLDRSGSVVTVEAHGREKLAMCACWVPLTLPKGMKKTDAIRRILAERAGEIQFDIPDLPNRLPAAMSLTVASSPWLAASGIAKGMGLHLYYDGAGTCRLRRLPSTAQFTFKGTTLVTAEPQISWDDSMVANAVYVLGGVPKGSKTHVTASAVAPSKSPTGPLTLGRNGVARYLLPDSQVINDPSITTKAEAQKVADQKLADILLQSVDVAFDSVPVPVLDPGDMCHVATDETSVTFRLVTYSLPLTVGNPMAVGYSKRVARDGVKRMRK